MMQARAIQLFEANVVGGENKTVEQILLEAGFGHESARQQSNVMAGIKPHLLDTVDWMKKHRMAVQAQMDLKIDDATYDELRKSMDTLTYNIQLLGGKPTANIAISAEVRHRIDALIED
ncbi:MULTISPECIES: hypothetical protein [unclassified Bradyrhizobium]|jgi:hypothetical protein|uniref:hypothetical protein n=1 Tax=unclassified Bradyrhizobium TaxID=2631580 RepID=UPI001044FBA1|nr:MULTISPECIES: hypothetical protein [unclassified Bradyrhizobium]